MELVECTSQYWEFVRGLRNNDRVSEGFIQSVYIINKMQDDYMSKYSQFYRIALVNGVPAGYVGVIENDIRVCTSPEFQRMRLGRF